MAPPPLLQVSQLNRFFALKLEEWKEVRVEGEISDLSRPRSGHLYFSLNDAKAQVGVVIYASDAIKVRANMQNGERIQIRGRFTFYQPRGKLQLTAYDAEPAGEGDKSVQLAKLKKKLADEGLFATGRKRALPMFPRVVAVVTSQAGAALYDIIRVASARAPLRIVVAHCQVQGPDAGSTIVRALRAASNLDGVEVVILARGGGASVDLSAFDEEQVARAIFSSPVPVVSGIGHEVDQTIADLVADLQAATPSNAAELVVPSREALRRQLDALLRRLQQGLRGRVGTQRLAIERLGKQLRDPRRALSGVRERFAASVVATERAVRRGIALRRAELAKLTQRLARVDPRAALVRDRARLEALNAGLTRAGRDSLTEYRGAHAELSDRALVAMRPRLAEAGRRLGELTARLDAMSPLAVLGRGYAIAIHCPSGRALTRSEDARVGDRIELRLASGQLEAHVQKVVREAAPEARSEDRP